MAETAAQEKRSNWPFEGLPHRLVIKLGSNVLSTPQGTLDVERVGIVSRQISLLLHQGSQVLIVTSGAVAAGMGVMGFAKRPTELPELQGLAAIGQCQLMNAYGRAFGEHGINVAQVLITRSDLEDRRRYLNAQYTLESLLAMGVVPIINENDTVITEELTVGDNDMLSAIIAAKVTADLLVILTDINGLYTANPKTDPNAELIEAVKLVDKDIEKLATGPGSAVGRGGMITKVAAARHAATFGVPSVVANGRVDNAIADIAAGRLCGTYFQARKPKGGRGRARVHWISMRRPKGVLTIDDGARRALVEMGKSLLPVGVVAVEGAFEKGGIVSIRTKSGEEIARGISNFTAEQLRQLCGRKACEFSEILGSQPGYAEAVHRDNLHVRV